MTELWNSIVTQTEGRHTVETGHPDEPVPACFVASTSDACPLRRGDGEKASPAEPKKPYVASREGVQGADAFDPASPAAGCAKFSQHALVLYEGGAWAPGKDFLREIIHSTRRLDKTMSESMLGRTFKHTL